MSYIRQTTGDKTLTQEAVMVQLDTDLAIAEQASEFLYYNNQDKRTDEATAEYIAFKTSFTSEAGDDVWAKCQKNRRPGAQPWYGLWFVAINQEVRIRDIFFPEWDDMLRFLQDLADIAIPEPWTYQQYASKVNHPILKSYIENIYDRLVQQNKLVQLEDGLMAFNTGLINKWFREIYIVCERDSGNNRRYINPKPYLESDRAIMNMFHRASRPEMASFFQSISDIVFDPDIPVYPDDEHIIEDNFERIPSQYSRYNLKALYALMNSAIDAARIMAKRNYKLIVPQFHHGQIQFLMPVYLSLEFTGPPDFALVLEKMGDSYRGNTILTLDMAYQNARLIAKPEAAWLNLDLGYGSM